jgi:transposase-like protein
MSIHRTFSPQFRREIVYQIISGQKSRAQICREYQLAPRVVGRWKAAYLQKGEQAWSRQPPTIQQLSESQHVQALQRLCGQLSLENALLKKALGKTRLPLPNAMP